MIVGQCTSMCPASELRFHRNAPSVFECDPKTGKFNPKLAVKQYSRSNSGAIRSPAEIRPLEFLLKSYQHLISHVLPQKDKGVLAYNYLSDRFRAIRQEIVIQRLEGEPEVQKMLEEMGLYLAWAGVTYDVDLKLNEQQIIDCLQHRKDLLLLLSIDSPNFTSLLMALSDDQLDSAPVRLAMRERAARVRLEARQMVAVAQEGAGQKETVLLARAECSIAWDVLAALRAAFRGSPVSLTLIEALAGGSLPPGAVEEAGAAVAGGVAKFDVKREQGPRRAVLFGKIL